MAKAEQKTVKTIKLQLDEKEAGYLLDLLSGYVAGDLARDPAPLGRIRLALEDAEVERYYAVNINYGASKYAILTDKVQ